MFLVVISLYNLFLICDLLQSRSPSSEAGIKQQNDKEEVSKVEYYVPEVNQVRKK